MAKAQRAPKSIRFPEEVEGRVEADAQQTGVAFGNIVISAVRQYYKMDAPPTKMRAGITKPHVNAEGMQVGAITPPAGSRLKQPPKKPERWRV